MDAMLLQILGTLQSGKVSSLMSDKSSPETSTEGETGKDT